MGVYDVSGTRPKTGKSRAVKGKGGAQRSGSKRTNILAAVAFAMIVIAVGVNVLPKLLSRPSATIPEEMIGVWETRGERFADRTFEISTSTVLFRTGTGESDFTFHEIDAVERDQGPDGMEYTFTYGDGGEFSFIFRGVEGTIQLMNQRGFHT